MFKDFRPFKEPMFLIAVGSAAVLLGSVGLMIKMAE
jgi:hypothetical protein